MTALHNNIVDAGVWTGQVLAGNPLWDKGGVCGCSQGKILGMVGSDPKQLKENQIQTTSHAKSGSVSVGSIKTTVTYV